MPHVFRPRANTIAKATLLGTVLLIAGLSVLAERVIRSAYVTQVGIPKQQPVAYSHRTHVGKLGMDCRYCHTAVEESSFAGLPPTETCMNCHSQIQSRTQTSTARSDLEYAYEHSRGSENHGPSIGSSLQHRNPAKIDQLFHLPSMRKR